MQFISPLKDSEDSISSERWCFHPTTFALSYPQPFYVQHRASLNSALIKKIYHLFPLEPKRGLTEKICLLYFKLV